MAVELMMGYTFVAKMEETALKEAAAAGIQGVEELVRLMSKAQHLYNQDDSFKSSSSSSSDSEQSVEIQAVTDKTVNSFKKVISLLGRPRTGHARFRRAPLTALRQEEKHQQLDSQQLNTKASAFRPFCPAQQVHRLPPLPHNHPQSKNSAVSAAKTGVSERNEAPGNINFSSMTGETDSMQPSFSSLAPSSGKPPLSSSLKRKCNSMDAAALTCGS